MSQSKEAGAAFAAARKSGNRDEVERLALVVRETRKEAAKKPKYRMFNEMVLVKRHDAIAEAETEVEKNYADVSGSQSNKATVIAVHKDETEIVVGSVIVFSEAAANDIELEGEKYLLLHRRQVFMEI